MKNIFARCVGGLLLGTALLAAGCASKPDRYKLPPPRNTQPLPTAQGVVYGKATAAIANTNER